MKIIIKRPNKALEIIEVKDLKEINKLIGNIDENGEGINKTNSDLRIGICEGIDMYLNEKAIFSDELPENFWDTYGSKLYCGNVIFAGYDSDNSENCGACSLTDEQIDYLLKNLNTIFDI